VSIRLVGGFLCGLASGYSILWSAISFIQDRDNVTGFALAVQASLLFAASWMLIRSHIQMRIP
jgi:hypothetical protein